MAGRPGEGSLAGGLVERDEELGALTELVADAEQRQGAPAVVQGPAGIGKTSLLEATAAEAAGRGFRVLRARGSPLETDLGFGLIRHLFEVVATSEGAALLRGPAGPAAAAVAPHLLTSPGEPADATATLHGLYWFTARLADDQPLALVVDDLQWADPPSARALAHLSRRLEGLPVALVAATRTGEPSAVDLAIEEVQAAPGCRVVRPAPLTPSGVAALLGLLEGDDAAAFLDASYQATGGNPFLVRELARVIEADGIEATMEGVGQVAAVGPPDVARSVLLRLAARSDEAVATAQAVAVLGPHARADRIVTLTGIDRGAVSDALDDLVRMEVLVLDPGIAYAHPLVERAVYEDLPPVRRGDWHAVCAELLEQAGAPPGEVAAHLLRVAPKGSRSVVGLLRRAAVEAVARGAPDSAVAYLRRALEEDAPLAEVARAELLRDLGTAEATLGDPRHAEHLRAALAGLADRRERAGIAYVLSEYALVAGRWDERITLLDDGLQMLGREDPVLSATLEAAWLATVTNVPDLAPRADERLPHLRNVVASGRPEARPLALAIANHFASTCTNLDQVVLLTEMGFAGGAFVREAGPQSLVVAQGVAALMFTDRLDVGERATAEVLDLARRRGSALGHCAGFWYRGWLAAQRGQMREAEADYRTVVDMAIEHDWQFAVPSLFAFSPEAFVERPGLADLVAYLDSYPLDSTAGRTGADAFLLGARGRLRALSRDAAVRAGGIADLRRTGEIFERLGRINPLELAWRSSLALALPSIDREEAVSLLEEEIAIAAGAGFVRAEGVARRAAGLLAQDADAIDSLEESVRLLSGSPARLELGRSMVELGAAHRRGNRRSEAERILREGLDLAEDCGAERLADRALEELRIAGARPRRRRLVGPGSMTPSEERVALLAASGATNREIAEELYVSIKTVEHHLASTYRKLGIAARSDLAGALRSSDPS